MIPMWPPERSYVYGPFTYAEAQKEKEKRDSVYSKTHNTIITLEVKHEVFDRFK
jgi:hypothetical protein